LRNRALVLLSGEVSSIPPAEAKSLFLAYDPASTFEMPHPRLLLVDSSVDPFLVGKRIAYARRVGLLVDDIAQSTALLKGHSLRFGRFDLNPGLRPVDPERYLQGIDATVDLTSPDYELSLVRTDRDYLSITAPGSMLQGWSKRRPRTRTYFHPSAIFPKLSRALVNLSQCREGESFLDPFCGTGSLPIEAHICGARVVAVDQAEKMTKGALANMQHFGQEWMGCIRADSTSPPITKVDAVATDIPYGRASSTRGRTTGEIIGKVLPALAELVRPRARVVLMHQKEVKVGVGREFVAEEEHDLHVHKRLTRTISVLRRR
jgi:tRNA (guanine10-N2)-dimethyltransferase